MTDELKDLLGKYQTAVNERNFSVWSCFLDLRKISPKLAAGGSLASRRSLRGDQLFQKLNEVKGTYLRAVQAGLGQGERAGLGQGERAGLVEHVLHVFDALPGLLDGVPLEPLRLNDLPQSNDVVRCGDILRVLQGVPTLNWLREAVANYNVRFRWATPSGVSTDDHSRIIACHDCIEPREDRARRFFAGSAMLSSGMFLAREWDGADPDTLVHFVTNPGTKTRAGGSSRSRGTIQGNVSESERLGRLLGFTKQDGETAPAALARLGGCLRTYLLNGGRFLTMDPGKGSHYYLELTAKDADRLDEILPDLPVAGTAAVQHDPAANADTNTTGADGTAPVVDAGTAPVVDAGTAPVVRRGQRLSEVYTYKDLSRDAIREFKRGAEYAGHKVAFEEIFGVEERYNTLYAERRQEQEGGYAAAESIRPLDKLAVDRAKYGVADLEKNTSLAFNTLMSEQFKDQVQRAPQKILSRLFEETTRESSLEGLDQDLRGRSTLGIQHRNHLNSDAPQTIALMGAGKINAGRGMGGTIMHEGIVDLAVPNSHVFYVAEPNTSKACSRCKEKLSTLNGGYKFLLCLNTECPLSEVQRDENACLGLFQSVMYSLVGADTVYKYGHRWVRPAPGMDSLFQ